MNNQYLAELKENVTVAKRSHIRCHLLLTFPHAERRASITIDILKERLMQIYDKTEVLIICREKQKDEGFHFHAGLKTTVSRHTALKILGAAFPEWTEKSLDLKFRRGWPALCSYLTKQDKDFRVWGASREEVLNQSRIDRNHRKRHLSMNFINCPVVINHFYSRVPPTHFINNNKSRKDKLLEFAKSFFLFSYTVHAFEIL